jgi:uncharacterized membrane protein
MVYLWDRNIDMVGKSVAATGLELDVEARLQRAILEFSRHWLAWINLLWGILIGLPWLAPVMMHLGTTRWARAIYAFYGLLCHQLANRSFFLFGPKWMYSYNALLIYAADAYTVPGLRAFIGNPELGYKVAWSDRMVSLYGGIFLGGIIFALLRRRLKLFKWVIPLLMIVPIVIDGGTHMISDLSGIGSGFRYNNAWLAYLTRNSFPPGFYVGNELGSFNSWMRLITGSLAGLAITWLVYPLLDSAFRDTQHAVV